MAVTKRSKASTARKSAVDEAVAVLEKGPQVVPVSSDFDDELDDILGELVDDRPTPASAAPPHATKLHVVGADDEPADALDDILNALAEPDSPASDDSLDDILGELAAPVQADPQPEPAEPDLDDILSALAAPGAPIADDSFDDILSELAPASRAEESLDDILSGLSEPAPAPAAPTPAPALAEASLDDILSEVARGDSPPEAKAASTPAIAAPPVSPAPPVPAPATSEADAAAPAVKKPGIGAKLGALLGSFKGRIGPPRFDGTRQISHKAYFGLIGLSCVLASAAFGEAMFIIARPAAHAPAHAVHVPGGTTLVPVDYSKVDLDLYRDKVRSLGEGGRDMLRHAKIKAAIVGLDNGEELYADLRALAARSPLADQIGVQGGRVSIASCNGGACPDKSFKLVYDIAHESATVCLTEKYIDGAMMSYSYSADGYRERPGC